MGERRVQRIHTSPGPSRAPHLVARDLGIAALLLLATLIVYGGVRHHEFVNYDDPDYTTENRQVVHGLTTDGVRWALTSMEAGNWFPLTWLSHMLDSELYGANAGGHHVTNLILHALSTLLLYALLIGVTGTRWPSALVAFLFAVHPQHVESVAWVAERKDVLSGFFWFVTIAVYAWYAGRPSRLRYGAVLIAFGLALMSKAMVVTLPVVLLVLDVWPLRRLSPGVAAPGGEGPPARADRARRRGTAPGRDRASAGRDTAIGDGPTRRAASLPALVLEKLPLVALAVATAIVTFVSQRGAGAVSPLLVESTGLRLANAVVSVVLYLRDLIWPANLAVFYPYPEGLPAWQVGAACAVLAGISAGAWRVRHERPWLLVGWLWFLVTLLPVIGLIQVGAQARADRYMYLPSVGIFIMIAWGLGDLWTRAARSRPVLVGLTAAVCVVLALATERQVRHWRSSITLFERALAVTSRNDVAHNNLGQALREAGRLDEARAHFEQALRIRPRFADALNNLGELLLALDRPADALGPIEEARRVDPTLAGAAVNFGTALARLGRLDEATAAFRAAADRWPTEPGPRAGLGTALASQGRLPEALPHLREAVRLGPADAEAQYNLGQVLAALGHLDEASRHFIEATRLAPDFAEAHVNLGNVMASQGRMQEAAAAFGQAVRLRPTSALAHSNLGSALASLGDLETAIRHLREAVRLDPDVIEARQNLEHALALRAGQAAAGSAF